MAAWNSGGAADRLVGGHGRHHRRAFWETIGIALATVIGVAAGILGLWVTSTDAMQENYRHALMRLAQTAAPLVNPALHRALRRPEQRNGPDYVRVIEPLRRMQRANPDIREIYTLVPYGSGMRFVLDTGDPGHHPPAALPTKSDPWEVYEARDPAMIRALGHDGLAGQAAAIDRPFRDQWGTFMTGWAPILGVNGQQIGILGVDVDASDLVAQLRTARNTALLGLIPALILIALLAASFYRIRLRGLNDARLATAGVEILARERQRFRTVIEATDVGTWECDLTTGVTVVNDRWAAMIGHRREELAPLTKERWQSLVHPDDLPGMEHAIAACLAAPGKLLARELRLQHAEGHWVRVAAHGRVLERDARGAALLIAGVHREVAEARRRDRPLSERQAHEKLTLCQSPHRSALH